MCVLAKGQVLFVPKDGVKEHRPFVGGGAMGRRRRGEGGKGERSRRRVELGVSGKPKRLAQWLTLA